MKNLKKLSRVLTGIAISGLLIACQGQKEEVKETAKDKSEPIKIGAISYIEHISLDNSIKGFEDRLKEKGINAIVEVENLQGDQALTTTVPKKFEGDEYKLVYAVATPPAQGAKTALPNKNIVYAAVSNPIKAGLIEAPDKIDHVTGVNNKSVAKEYLTSFLELYPDVKRIGTLYSPSEVNAQVQVEDLKNACDELGIKLELVGISSINDVSQALSGIVNKIDAYYAITDNVVAAAAPIVAKTLLDNKLPSVSAEEGQVVKGLLISDGVDYYEHGKQAADLAIRLLNGEDIKNVHAEDNKVKSRKVNENTAKALGLDLKSDYFKNAILVK